MSKNVIGSQDRKWLFQGVGLAIVIIVLGIVFSIINPRFGTLSNFLTILTQASYYIILSVGMTFVITSAGIDLSVGSLLAVITVIGFELIKTGTEPLLGVSIMFILGASFGCLNGILISKIKIPPYYCEKVELYVEKERKILKEYGGGCHQKIGVSHQIIEMGEVLNLKGETEEGLRLSENSFFPKTNFTDELISEIKSIYPKKPENSSFFDRENIEDSSNFLKEIINSGIYVSRSNALDSFNDIKESNTIWTSGIKTWLSLSSKGLWVNGTSDSLGEVELSLIHI